MSREVLLLKEFGVQPDLFASMGPDQTELAKMSPLVAALKKVTHYISSKRALKAVLKSPLKALAAYGMVRKLAEEASIKPNILVLLGRAIALGEACKKEDISHVHAHWPYASMVVYLSHKIYGLSFSISIHAHEVFHENGHFPRILPHVSFASFCNLAALEAAKREYPQSEERFHLIYHGVNLDNFSVYPTPKFDGKNLNIISAGRLTQTKGFDRLIRATKYAQDELGTNINLTILGEGGEKESLLNLANEIGFKNLELTGWVSQSVVRKKYSESHLFALLANVNYHDGLPNVLLEAMSVGRLAICSPLPAAAEAIAHGVNGYILGNESDNEGFTQALKQVCDHSAFDEMGLRARKKVEESFADHLHIKSMIDLFENSNRN